MTLIQQLEQTEAIEVLKKMRVLPINYKFLVVTCNKEKVIRRTYHIDEGSNKYPLLDTITIEYRMNIHTERITDYSVYLTNDSKDILYLCKYSPRVLNTLFNNIISLELSNWHRIINHQEPLRTMDDYKSLMFELGAGANRKLKRIIENNTNTSKLLNQFHDYLNSNEIIPITKWESQII